MTRLALLLLALFVAPQASAQTRYVLVETVIEEWVVVEGGERFVAAAPAIEALPAGIARFGPFRVLDGARAALVGRTDARSPEAFAAMLAAYPALERIDMIEAPGTADDRANLALGRAIRAAGLATHVPAGGSVRSGAVELFLAGARRSAADGARFAVHSWRDEWGRGPHDLTPDAPANRAYLDYYTEMGFAPAEAAAFYAMTNSVPHEAARWLDAAEMQDWLPADRSSAADAMTPRPGPRLAYAELDLTGARP